MILNANNSDAVARSQTSVRVTLLVLFVWLGILFALWRVSYYTHTTWPGVPPVPSKNFAPAMGFGDRELAYRMGATGLQNMGDGGGRVTPLLDYDYALLFKWFQLLHHLNPKAEAVPLLAGYYYSFVKNPEQQKYVVAYLAHVGYSLEGEKWRWLAQAVFLARHRLRDLDYALKLANDLASLYDQSMGTMPLWTKQMPAFVMVAMDEKEAARQLIEAILATNKTLPKEEINFMKSFIDEQLDEKFVPDDVLDRAEDYEKNRGRYLNDPDLKWQF